jgi:ABC-2 type transport system permease protein
MRSFWRKISTMLSVHYAVILEYRAEIFLWAISGSLPLILAGVWYKASADGGAVFQLAPHEYVRYFFASFVVRQMTLVWVIWEFEHQVVQGTLSLRLLQPIDPGWHHVTEHLSERLARIPVLLLLGLVFFLLYPAALSGWPLQPASIALGLLAILTTFMMRFCVQYCFAMLSFWIERAWAIEQLWYLPYLFFSGLIAPLDDYPPAFREFLLLTPFPYLIYFPSKLLTGQINPADDAAQIIQGFTVTLVWTVVFHLLHRRLWRAGLRHYTAMGA